MHTGSFGFVKYKTHAQAAHAIVAINGQMVGDNGLKCGWGQLQPRQSCTPALETPHMQHPLGYMWPQSFLGFMSPMLGMPGGMQMPCWHPSSGSAQILFRQHAPQLLPVEPQTSGSPTTVQHQMLAGQGVKTDHNNLYVYGSMYNAP